jgi:hypothetical protein
MPNKHILKRLSGVQGFLMSAFESGADMTSNSKGVERELFINRFLAEMLPPPYRLGSGEATDREGNITGQLDIVLEYPFLPSIPVFGTSQPRLYLADAVATVIEVKSNVAEKWKEVAKTCATVKALKRTPGTYQKATMDGMINSGLPPFASRERIPFIAVGYKGWRSRGLKQKTMQDRLKESCVDAILIIDESYYCTNPEGELSGTVEARGGFAFWAFISAVHETTKYITRSTIRLGDYVDERAKPIRTKC